MIDNTTIYKINWFNQTKRVNIIEHKESPKVIKEFKTSATVVDFPRFNIKLYVVKKESSLQFTFTSTSMYKTSLFLFKFTRAIAEIQFGGKLRKITHDIKLCYFFEQRELEMETLKLKEESSIYDTFSSYIFNF